MQGRLECSSRPQPRPGPRVQPHTPIHSSKPRLTLGRTLSLRPDRADHSVLRSLQISLRLPVTLYCGNGPGRGWMLFISVPQARALGPGQSKGSEVCRVDRPLPDTVHLPGPWGHLLFALRPVHGDSPVATTLSDHAAPCFSFPDACPLSGLAGLCSHTLAGGPRLLCLAAWDTRGTQGGRVSQGSTFCHCGTVTPPFKASATPVVSLLFFLALRRVLSSRRRLNLCRRQFHFAGSERTHRSFLACATFWLLDIFTPSSPSPQTPTQIFSAFTICQELTTALPAHGTLLSPFHR